MTLGTTDIAITDVIRELNYEMYSLSHLVTDAATGGTGGNAFDVNGYLISGALPYWNIYAYNIPAVWIIEGVALKLRLEYVDSIPVHRLGDFRGYNHDARHPQAAVPESLDCISGTLHIGVSVSLYEWNLPASCTHIKIKAVIDSATQYELLTVSALHISFTDDVYFTFTGVSTSILNGYVQLYGSNADGDELTNITNTMCGDDLYPISFTITHSTASATLARAVTPDSTVDISFTTCEISNPAGTGNISIATGQTTLSAIVVKIVAASADVTEFTFKLYFNQTNETAQYVNGSVYTGYASSTGYTNYFYLPVISLGHPAETGEAMSFYMDDLLYAI